MSPSPRPPLTERPGAANAGDGVVVVSPGCGDSECVGGHHPHAVFRKNLFSAAKAGNLPLCQEIVESEGIASLSRRDAAGHTAAHWAALGGHVAVLRYFAECGGGGGGGGTGATLAVNAPSDAEPGSRPIHWAATNGHVAAMEALLVAGVPIDEPDQRGCTPLVVAAQFGQTALAGYLLGRGAALQACDTEGDNALHWAAFKGHCELTRLLTYSGFNPRQTDKFQQTPLHLAVLSGDLLTVKLLCEQDEVELNVMDANGNTPLALAQGRKYGDIVAYLAKATARSRSLLQCCDLRSLVLGPPGKSKAPVMFFYCTLLLWGYPTYVLHVLPLTLLEMKAVNVTFVAGNLVMWYAFLRASLSDPGFLPQNNPDYDHAIKQMARYADCEHAASALSRLCHTCRLVRPLRSKHCRVANRCVDHFDHYCPYVYNTVGFRNRFHFLGFLASMSLNCWLGVHMAWSVLSWYGRDLLLFAGLLFLCVFGTISGGMTIACLYMAGTNSTTNERINGMRYDYMKDEHGRFFNPFDRGVVANLLEFAGAVRPLGEAELQRRRRRRDGSGVSLV
ncbi:palmitoyltransferase Hip14-like [Lampetra fluviatilis]